MFRRFRHSKAESKDLLVSALYCDKTFYRAFVNDLRHAQNEVIIESPFLACKRTESFLPVFKKLAKRDVTVRVNTRNPWHHDEELRIQAWISIKQLRAAGVKVKFYNDLRHRKLAFIDRAILWEGSLNILSQSSSREVMRRTNSAELTLRMLRFTGAAKWSW